MSNGWWVTNLIESQGMHVLVAWIFWVVLSIVLHELAHGWAAIAVGDETPRETGHLTINPFVHMPPLAWLMFALVGITWGLMPVNPARMKGRHADALVSAAGPAMNVVLFGLAVVGYVLWVGIAGGYWTPNVSVNDEAFKNMQVFFRLGAALNITLVLFNLIPAPPLDGSRILASFVAPYRNFVERSMGSPLGILPFILVFWFAGRFLVPAGRIATETAIGALLPVLVPGLK